jgi:hypothetical protein
MRGKCNDRRAVIEARSIREHLVRLRCMGLRSTAALHKEAQAVIVQRCNFRDQMDSASQQEFEVLGCASIAEDSTSFPLKIYRHRRLVAASDHPEFLDQETGFSR